MSALQFPSILKTLKTSHPRLIASETTWDTLKARRREDAALDAFLKRSELEARALLDVPPMTYQLDASGRRLLRVSRRVLRRVLLLAQQFHLTGDAALAKRAEEEMLSAAAFNDWNPTHFLDTAEMTAALAFGTDWLYLQLDEGTRQTIRTAIIEKGLKEALPHRGWMTVGNNWNQVCLGGLSLGALAIAEEEPEFAAQILEKARDYNQYGLKPYAPAGVYPEGAMYWAYGTTYQVVLLAALESALGTDWGLSQSPGFLQTADALLQTQGPTGAYFNFYDGYERPSLEGGNYWFAHKLNRPELVSFEAARLQRESDLRLPTQTDLERERFMPLAAIWWPETHAEGTTAPRYWYGAGPNPLAAFRDSWNDPNAMFLALKGGTATNSHAHMDAGSFVFESDGVRFASDLGWQPYPSLEAKKVVLWDSKQDGGRWSVFRLNNFSHNTLTIDGQLHRANGHAAITHFSREDDGAGAIVDLSPVFEGQASRVTRGLAFRSRSHALVRDEIEGLKAGAIVRWAMLTQADIAIAESGTQANLSLEGKQLTMYLSGPDGAQFEVISADPPQNDYDAPNPGFRFLIAHFSAPISGVLSWSVLLQPGAATEERIEDPWMNIELNSWPLAPTE